MANYDSKRLLREIERVRGNQRPEDKLEIVRAATAQGTTPFLGVGINDAPAVMAATVEIDPVGPEVIDLLAALNAVRASSPTRELQDS